jgi:hypothetical protein
MRNHADGIASIDLFVVPTISFRLRRVAETLAQASDVVLLTTPQIEPRSGSSSRRGLWCATAGAACISYCYRDSSVMLQFAASIGDAIDHLGGGRPVAALRVSVATKSTP